MHQKRNEAYHGKMIMLPTKRDLEAWSGIVGVLLREATGVDSLGYFEKESYERVFLCWQTWNMWQVLKETLEENVDHTKKPEEICEKILENAIKMEIRYNLEMKRASDLINEWMSHQKIPRVKGNKLKSMFLKC